MLYECGWLEFKVVMSTIMMALSVDEINQEQNGFIDQK
jgi:hypothetical protein